MKFEPYSKLVRSIIVQELKDHGWIELIVFPIDTSEKASPEEIQATIEEVHKLFYEADKLELSIQGQQLCVRGLKSKTFRICASYTDSNCPFTI